MVHVAAEGAGGNGNGNGPMDWGCMWAGGGRVGGGESGAGGPSGVIVGICVGMICDVCP